MISNGVMKTGQCGSMYEVKCGCGCSGFYMIVTHDTDPHEINLEFIKELEWNEYWGKDTNWFMRKWKQIKAGLKLLFLGKLKINDSLQILHEDHLKDLIEALTEIHIVWREDIAVAKYKEFLKKNKGG